MMRNPILIVICLCTISGIAQKLRKPGKTYELRAVYNLVIQLPTTDIYFSIKTVQEEIAHHDWTVAGKTESEVSKLKSWLERYNVTGLLVTPAMLKDKASGDYSSIKLLSEYVSGLMMQPILQGRVYVPRTKPMIPQPIEYREIIITKNPYVSRYEMFLMNAPKPFLLTQGIGTSFKKVKGEPVTEVLFTDAEETERSEKREWMTSYDYKTFTIHKKVDGISSYHDGGITTQGDTVMFVNVKNSSFKGGAQKLEEFLAIHAKFPESAINAGIYGGFVEIYVTVMKDGSVKDLVAAEGDARLQDEAVRLLKETSGMWSPFENEENKKINIRGKIELLLYRPSR